MSWCARLVLALAFAAPVLAAGKLDLNKATKDELLGLGLSESQAQQVLSHRQKSGPFLQIDELLVVPQMRRELVEKIRPRVTVDE